MVKTANNENIIKTAFHEIFHVLQHACIVESKLGIYHNIFTKEELIKMEKEFYKSSGCFDDLKDSN